METEGTGDAHSIAGGCSEDNAVTGHQPMDSLLRRGGLVEVVFNGG